MTDELIEEFMSQQDIRKQYDEFQAIRLLEPCPFCRDINCSIEYGYRYHIECTACHARGPSCAYVLDASRRWNDMYRRAAVKEDANK